MSAQVEFALMVDWEDGQSPEFIPATDAHHAEEMARKIYQGRSTWTVQRQVNPWCYLEGWRGHYVSRDAVRLAQSFGWQLSESDAAYVDAYESGSMVSPLSGEEIGAGEIAEAVFEIATDAVDYLNSVTAPGAWWEFVEGGVEGGLFLLADDDEMGE